MRGYGRGRGERKRQKGRENIENQKRKKNYELREEGRKPREHTANRDQKVGKRKPSVRIMLAFPVTWQDEPRR